MDPRRSEADIQETSVGESAKQEVGNNKQKTFNINVYVETTSPLEKVVYLLFAAGVLACMSKLALAQGCQLCQRAIDS
jgi:hypothetical protein